MGGRVYPLVFFIVVSSISEVLCKGNGSLTFVIDDTGSMYNDIDQVRVSVNQIMDTVFNEKSSLTDNMVLVTFNDPDAEVRISTRDRYLYKRRLDEVYAHNVVNNDCWEPAMKGVLLALEKSNRDSYMYVFTDAPARDYRDAPRVIELCQRKQTQIVFVLTGNCYGYHIAEASNVYFEIAKACSGLAFQIHKSQVSQVLGPIKEIIKGNKSIFVTATLEPNQYKNIPFTIDDHTDYAIISVSGKHPRLNIRGPSAYLEDLMNNDNGRVVKLSNIRPGEYVATVGSQSRTSIIIVGRTDFFFTPGFSESKPKSSKDATPQPIADTKVHLSASVTDGHHSVQIVSAEIVQMDDRVIQTLPLTPVSTDFYVTDPFVAPSQMFKVVVNGIIKATGKPIKRFAKLPVTSIPQPRRAPTAVILQGTSLQYEYNDEVKLTCKVEAYPEPKIKWVNSKGITMQSTTSRTDVPYEYISNIKTQASKNDKYICYAENNEGKSSASATVMIKDPFNVKQVPSGTAKISYGSEGTITCDISSRFPMEIHWYHRNDITGMSKEIQTSDKTYWISASHTQLKIRKMDMDLAGHYICKAFLKNQRDMEKVFGTTVSVDGLVAPKLLPIPNIRVTKGKIGIIECKVLNGVPAPKITWFSGGQTGTKFTLIPISGNVLTITNVEEKHGGKYKCVAENDVGKDERITRLIIQDLPTIVPQRATVYMATEGDATLSVPCVASGLPKPVIIWKINNKELNPGKKYAINDGTLVIRDPNVDDSNLYTCVAKNDVGSVSETFKTFVRQIPKVSGVASIKGIVGNAVKIECRVSKGVPRPKITWQFEDNAGTKFIPLTVSERVLSILKVENKHAGRYKCVAQNDVGSAEHVTTLVLQDLPTIVPHRATVYMATEGDATLSVPCVASGLPKPVIIWKINNKELNPGKKYAINDGTLVIRDPNVDDSNLYTCVAKNDVGSVSETFKTFVRQIPKVSGVASIKGIVGNAVNIECRVFKGVPRPKVTWQFADNAGKNFIPLSVSERVLSISKVENKHAGRYKCVAQNNVGSAEHVTTLVVQDRPKILSNTATVYQAIEGDALLRIPCVSSGLPKPNITWKLNEREITSNAKYSLEDGALVIKQLTVRDSNSYTCEATNEAGSVSATFKIYVRQKPELTGVATKNVRVGQTAVIECKVIKGEPKPKLSWYVAHGASEFVYVGENVAHPEILQISSAEEEDAARYKCVAENDVGNAEHVTTLVVESPPKITSNSTTVKGIEGDLALRIPCDVVGVPRPVITWKIKGVEITPNSKYIIEDGDLVIKHPIEKDTAAYTCEAKNYIGSNSATFEVDIDKKLHDFGTTHFVYLLIGETKKLECDAYKSNSQSIKWFKELIQQENKFVQINKASFADDGNYTCHVSDEHGHVQTHTYVVDVGTLPKLYTPNTLDDWRGDVNEIKSNCEVSEAKPDAEIKWYFNGKELTDKEVPEIGIRYKWGHYTCTASNVHGSVKNSFDVMSSVCLIPRNIRDAAHMPLALTNEGTWPKWDFTDDYTILEQNEKITLSCPNQKETSNTFRNFAKQSELKAICLKEDTFVVNGKNYKLSDLQCTNSIQLSVLRKQVKCSKIAEKPELVQVGYNVTDFLEIYDVCFDHAKNLPLYAGATMTKTDDSIGTNNKWYTYPGIGDTKIDRGFTCKDSMTSCCYGKSQLLNAKDFNYETAKKSTFIDYLNGIPIWRPCSPSQTKWEDIDDMIRKQLKGEDEIITWSGTHTFEKKHGAIIPRYLWKVIKFGFENSLAIVHVNSGSPTEKDIKCKNFCNEDDHTWFSVNDEYTYCCSLTDFSEAFGIDGTKIGESPVY